MELRLLAAACALALPLAGDEGLWLFNQFPAGAVQETYHFEVAPQFLDHLRLASVSLGGGSGAFVSSRGLLVTNQHLIADCLAKAGSAGHDYLADGFYAAAPADEARCAGLDASVLVKLDDVTAQVKSAAKDGMKPAEALEKRATAMAGIEKACAEKTANACMVVKLFSGERYDLYQYKKYTDLRLVFAPERAIAFFGGNPDSLAYPRYLFDVAFLRAYEDGRPASTPQFLKWSAQGVEDGELVFAAGSPQSTSRLATVAQLTFYRDVGLPFMLFRLQQRIQDLRAGAAKPGGRGAAEGRAIELPLTELGSSYKWTAGKLIGVKDDWLMARKGNFEKKLRGAVQSDPKLGAPAAKVWDDIATAYRSWTPFEKRYQVLENPGAVSSNLFRMARQMVRGPGDSPESTAVLDDGVETAMLARYLEDLKALGDKEVPLHAILGGKTPQQAAEEMVRGTRLKDAAERRRLAANHATVLASDDPLIRLARQLEEPARKVARKHAETIEALDTSATERIAHYRYQLFGAADYPDATGTPRAAYGAVKAYRDRTEAPAPYATTFSGLYYLAAGQYDNYKLPRRWVDGRTQLDPLTPMDFVSTCDVTAGAAGSPVINQKGELVGITFEGNLESIANTYLYLDDRARALHAATQAVTEALEKLYNARALLDELGAKPAASENPASH